MQARGTIKGLIGREWVDLSFTIDLDPPAEKRLYDAATSKPPSPSGLRVDLKRDE